jgi:hypothetical protein
MLSLNRQPVAGSVIVFLLALAGIFVVLVQHRYAETVSLDDDRAGRATTADAIHPSANGIESLDGDLEPVREANRVPALAAAFVRGERIVAMGAVGVRRAGSAARVDLSDRFHIGSCTKSMTATNVGDPAGGRACGEAALVMARRWLETHHAP